MAFWGPIGPMIQGTSDGLFVRHIIVGMGCLPISLSLSLFNPFLSHPSGLLELMIMAFWLVGGGGMDMDWFILLLFFGFWLFLIGVPVPTL